MFIPLLLALAPVTGCGENENRDAISKREYIARSNALCERTGRQADAAFKRMVGQEHPAPGQERAFMVKTQRFFQQAAIPAIRENVEKRRALPAPAANEWEIEAIIAAGEKALVRFEAIAVDRDKLRALFEGRSPTRPGASTRSADVTASTSAEATSEQHQDSRP